MSRTLDPTATSWTDCHVSPDLALHIIAEQPCENNTTGICPDHRRILLAWTAEKVCNPCLARLALDQLPQGGQT